MKRFGVGCAAAIAILAAAVTPGCQKKSESGASRNSDLSNFNATGLPIVKEKESFTILVDENRKVEDKKVLLDKFESETNVHLDPLLFPYASAVERKNILISSGDYPDVIGGWILNDNDIMTMGVKEGVFIPLEELFEKYAPNIMEALNEKGVREAMTLPDGHIYSPPYPIAEPTVTFNPWINEAWLKQVGLPMPETTEDLKNVLIAFRDNISTRDGQRIIPFSGDPVNMNLGQFAGWWGQPAAIGNRNGGGLAIINGELEITINRNEFKEMIKYSADLYKERLIDPELFTQDQATWKAKGRLGLYGVCVAYGPGDFENALNADVTKPRYNSVTLPVLHAPGVTKPVYRRNGFGMTIFRTQLVITDKAKNPETIVRWIDYIYDPVHSAECQWGLEGVSIEKGPDGEIHEIDRTGWSQEKEDEWTYGIFWFASLPKYLRGGNLLPPIGRAPEYKYNDVTDAMYEPFLEPEPAPQLWIAAADGQRAADLTTAIENYVKQKMAEWVSGQASVDAEWDAYVAQLDKLGIQELLAIKRKAMKR